MTYLIYVLVKLLGYAAWCWLGLRVWRPEAATLWPSLGFGVLRLIIGVVAGVSIFFLVRVERSDLLGKYIEIYAPVRLLEWFVLWSILRRTSGRAGVAKALCWCLGGIVVSFAADFASPEGLAGHFCVGRCLC